MIINADLHIHSRYSNATSNKMNIDTISKTATSKGVHILATGDCLHDGWLKEIKTCVKIDDGTFEKNGTRFILGVEIEGKKRVHHLLYFPSISSVEEFKTIIKPFSNNLEKTGRPYVNMNGEELASLAKDMDVLIGPSHAFTPWTSVYAHYSSIKKCYGDLTNYVSFIELGLSANSDYADKINELSRLTFLSNSDSHSPHPVRLAREFTRFHVYDINFDEIKKAILRTGGNKPILNVGLPPEEGKYNESACIRCYKHYTLEEAIKLQWKCKCGRKIKKGVKDRISEIANYQETKHPTHRPPYVNLIPMSEIISKAVGQRSPFTITASRRWNELIAIFGNEINILLDTEINNLVDVTVPAIIEAIQAFRENEVIINPGGGGKYGTIEFPWEDKNFKVSLG